MISCLSGPCSSISIQTIPDIQGLRRVYRLPKDLSDFEVAEYAFQRQRAIGVELGLPPHLLRVVSVSIVTQEESGIALSLFAEPELDERRILVKLGELIPQNAKVYSWGRRAADVMLCRALFHELALPIVAARDVAGTACFDLRHLLGVGGRFGDIGLESYAETLGDGAQRFVPVDGEDPWLAWLSGDIRNCRKRCAQAGLLSHYLLLRYQLVCGAIGKDDYEHYTTVLDHLLVGD